MTKTATVYKFNIWFVDADGKIDYDTKQQRFVVAETEKEAEKKLDKYEKELKENGFCGFVCSYQGVENDIVIF